MGSLVDTHTHVYIHPQLHIHRYKGQHKNKRIYRWNFGKMKKKGKKRNTFRLPYLMSGVHELMV